MLEKVEDGNGKIPEQSTSPQPQTDFKICEIWIRDGQLQLDGSHEFWADRVRALGTLEYCKDIVKYKEAPKPEKSKIIPARGQVMDFVRRGFKGKK